MSRFKPLLAATLGGDDDLQSLSYPMICSPKIDGIRVLIHPELGAVTRSLKPIPNRHIRTTLSDSRLHWFDGEIIIGDITAPNVFQATTSGVMSFDGAPRFQLYVFDHFQDSDAPYTDRDARLDDSHGIDDLHVLESATVRSAADVLAAEAGYLKRGFEGVMLRRPSGRYKYGRSTLREQILLKLKRMTDDEAVVIGFEPLERNINPATINLLGRTERSTAKAGKIAADTLGQLIVEHPRWGQFGLGSGFDDETRAAIWSDRPTYLGKMATFKYQATGIKDRPRFPIFKGFRLDL